MVAGSGQEWTDFEWDEAKRLSNLEKHGIDFWDAIGIFAGNFQDSPVKYHAEPRRIAVGILEGRFISVIYTIRANRLRIISARRSRENEKRAYRQSFPS